MPNFYRNSVDNCGRLEVNTTGEVNKAALQAKAHYCAECNRSFVSANNLGAHRRSAVHQPKDVHCPCKGCIQSFVSLSALILHLEFGYCRSGVNLTTVNKYVRQLDTEHLITDQTLLVNVVAASPAKDGMKIKTWNGTAYECYLCHWLFRACYSLTQHLKSPRHLLKIYMCPQGTCREHFSALSGLCQHIESGKCEINQKH